MIMILVGGFLMHSKSSHIYKTTLLLLSHIITNSVKIYGSILYRKSFYKNKDFIEKEAIKLGAATWIKKSISNRILNKLGQNSADSDFICLTCLVELIKKSMSRFFIKFTRECPLLEELSVFSCWGIKYICISKPLKLKTFLMVKALGEDYVESIKIVAPNLQRISLAFGDQQIETYVMDLYGCLQLTDLKLMGKIFKAKEFHDLISKFPLLEKLSVQCCCSLEKIMISSNRLKELFVDNCVNLKAIDVDTPNLLSFTYMFNPVSIFSINAPCPWRAVLDYGDADVTWYIKIKEFLWASNQIDDLTIFDSSAKLCLWNPYYLWLIFHTFSYLSSFWFFF